MKTWEEFKKQTNEARRIARETGVPTIITEQKQSDEDVTLGEVPTPLVTVDE